MSTVVSLLDSQSLLQHHFERNASLHSSQHLISLLAWASFYDYHLVHRPSGLMIFAENDQGCFNVSVSRDITVDDMRWCFDWMRERNGNANTLSRIEYVDEVLRDRFADDYEWYARPVDYVYWRQDIAALTGTALKAKRHDVNRVRLHHDVVFRPYHPDDYDACVALFDQWALQRKTAHDDVIYQTMIHENRVVHLSLLEQACSLGLDVRVVELAGRIHAYTAGFAYHPAVYCIYLEIASCDVPGLAAFTFHKFCQDRALEPYQFVNCMDDFAMDNVKKAKLSYQPSLLLSSYSLRLKE